MIIKILQGRDFGGLEHYLTHDREHEIFGFDGVSCAEDAAIEMGLVAAERPDVLAPALHVIFNAPPCEWSKLTDDRWHELLEDFEAEFHLSGHQKLIVKHPHPDPQTKGPHIHCAYNKVHPLTFDLPPVHKHDRASWDSGAKQRAWAVADAFAERHGLIRVADPTLVESEGRIPNWVRKREAADGVLSIAELAPQVRGALSKPDWPARVNALAEHGLKIVPTYPPLTGSGEASEISGIRIVDAYDDTNFLTGSDFGGAYSYPQLERARTPGTPSLSEAILAAEEEQKPSPIQGRQLDSRGLALLEFQREIEDWQRTRATNKAKRDATKARHMRERQELSTSLSAERKDLLDSTPSAFVSQAREAFTRMVSTPRRDALGRQQKEDLKAIKTPRKPNWIQWLEERATAGDRAAAEFLHATKNRKMASSKRLPPTTARPTVDQITSQKLELPEAVPPIVVDPARTASDDELKPDLIEKEEGPSRVELPPNASEVSEEAVSNEMIRRHRSRVAGR